MKKHYVNVCVDPVGYCPLKCLSCPAGRRENPAKYKLLQPDVLERILKRVSSQRPINGINLLGWCEPMLNPKMPELVRIAKRYGNVWISTAGNHWACSLEDFARSNPNRFSVSISGMTQATHAVTHGGGDLAKTMWFIEHLVELGMKFSIIFHRYNNNLHEEAEGRAYAKRLGLKWDPIWARHHAVEEMIAGTGNPYLIVPMEVQLEAARKQGSFDCPLRKIQLAMDAEGNVRGCVEATENFKVANIFDYTVDEIFEMKKSYHLCGPCSKAGVYRLACGQTIGADAEYAKHAGGTARDRMRWWWERTKKRRWVTKY